MRKIVASLIIALISVLLISVFLWYEGIIIPNASNIKPFPVKGVDVSSYQGEIEWTKIQDQGMSFAFIKATEGSSFIDPYYQTNWKNAQKTNLRIGAYHFFSFDSKGATQAKHFIETVPIDKYGLPPVIDVEFYADKEKNPPDRSEVESELQTMITMLEEHYEKKVILYTTHEAYELYIKDSFNQCDLWIRDVLTKPTLPDNQSWTFWQYTDREQLNGYNGEEKFIDVNVFHGNKKEFEKYSY